jgi:hypothetical protein
MILVIEDPSKNDREYLLQYVKDLSKGENISDNNQPS